MLRSGRRAGLRSNGWLFLVLVLSGLSSLSGCGGAAPVRLEGEPTDAVDIVNDVLKEWQAGKKVEDLKDEEPPIIVRDVDWEAGAKLKVFEIQKEATEDGGSWRVEAILTMEGKGLPSTPTVVAYSVTVDPKVLSILRKDQLE